MKCKYPIVAIIMAAVIGLSLSAGSMRAISESLNTEIAIKNVYEAAGIESLEELPHWSTISNVLKNVAPAQLEDLRLRCYKQAVKKGKLKELKIFGHALMLVDATWMRTYSKHEARMLSKKHKKGTKDEWLELYDVGLMACTIVSGMPFSVASTIIKNDPGLEEALKAGIGSEKAKQACELKAVNGVIDRIRHSFTRKQVCFVADSLYVSQNLLSKLEENDMRYVIRYKEGSAQSIASSVELNEGANSVKGMSFQEEGRPAESVARWLNGIDYYGHSINYVRLIQPLTDAEKKKIKKKRKKDEFDEQCLECGFRSFEYITDFEITEANYMQIVNAGRSRWAIEGYFRDNKQNFGLEHIYSYNENASDNIFQLLQVAHMLILLAENVCEECKGTASRKAFRQLCKEAFRQVHTEQQVQVRAGPKELAVA